MGPSSGFCGNNNEDRREEEGENVDWGTGAAAPELVDAECKIEGRRPALGSVVIVLQVEDRRLAGGSGNNGDWVSTGLRDTILPRRCVMPRAREPRRAGGELGPAAG